MPSNEKHKYWQDRFTQLHESQLDKGQRYYYEVEEQMRKAEARIQRDIGSWYARFAENNNISYLEAKRLLNSKDLAEFRWDVKDYIKYGEENALDPKWMKELENASARVHITRLESLKYQTQQQIEVLFGNYSDELDKRMQNMYKDGYYHIAYEIQKGFNVGWSLQSLDTRRIEQVISKPWIVDGKNFSERIWVSKAQLINTVHTQLTQAIIRGDGPGKAISAVAKQFNVSKNQAGRLIMTESAYFASAAQRDCFKDLDVERFEVVATLDNITSEICQNLDGKVFDMKDYQVGVTANPFHVECRSTTVPYFEDNYTERVARDKDGKLYYVPGDIKYPEWYNKTIKPTVEKVKLEQRIDKEKDLLNKIENEFSLKVRTQKQKEHILGESKWKERVKEAYKQDSSLPGAFFNKIDIQGLINKVKGTGSIDIRTNEKYPREYITLEKVVGLAFHYKKRRYVKTKRMAVHYSGKGVHAYPVLEKEGE